MIETHGRRPIAELAGRLDTVPRRKLEYKGTVFEEMDVDAILHRKPAVVLIDELAHTNIEGSKYRKSGDLPRRRRELEFRKTRPRPIPLRLAALELRV